MSEDIGRGIARLSFDPALFDDPSLPGSFDQFRIEGLKQHLRRYSAQQSPRNVLARLDDRAWLMAWDHALSGVAGTRVMFHGSELGVLGLRAHDHGASHVLCVEEFPLNARIATGMIQKHFLAPWHALHGAAIQHWSEEQRQQSFESFAKGIDIAALDEQGSIDHECDYFVFPQLDHSLLGTGIVTAIRRLQRKNPNVRILPARATIFAMAIQWKYPATSYDLRPMNRFRWSAYPQALELAPEFWTPLTAPMQVGEIELATFADTVWDVRLPTVTDGVVDAILFWFDLDLGSATLSSAPGSGLQCIKPAVQYVDDIDVLAGGSLPLRIHATEHRLHFQTQPPPSQLRSLALPGWYIPMLGDEQRNEAYRRAISNALATRPTDMALDIGAGCGLLSMMAAQAGVERVVGCEVHPALCEAGEDTIRLNRLDQRIQLLNKDCRSLKTEDLPQRADLALFELFDCSLIGEGLLHFLAHAREHLLTKDARYLPAAATIHATIIEYRIDRLWDIDANLLNPYRFSPSFINVDAAKLNYRALTEPVDLFSFDFATATPTAAARELSMPALTQGTAGAVLFWFDLRLDESNSISNAPGAADNLHWKQGLQFLPEVRVEPDLALPLLATHDGSGLKFSWRYDALPKQAFSKLPRFDPRWLAATQELEQQTRGLLQHCAQNEEEYAKVVEIAKRFAIQPAAHGLDPAIAQRFVAMFLNG